ncbi:MAG: hypothetical protein H0U50_07970 [Pyrinomonadaceae bacterium]|nr:hypothetical protein [Pyrinomonadaceae bacterium]
MPLFIELLQVAHDRLYRILCLSLPHSRAVMGMIGFKPCENGRLDERIYRKKVAS